MRRPFTIFFSWQSDIEGKFNRSFIQNCLERAAKALQVECSLEVAIRVDHDTKDVPGSPPIMETILQKIRACDAFVGDLTFVSTTEDTGVSNSNVLLELGYAMRCLSDFGIINVMNVAFGAPDGRLPFNLQHKRWPIQYCLDASNLTDKSSVRDDLVRTLTGALRTVLAMRAPEDGLRPLLEDQSADNIRSHILASNPREDWKLVAPGMKYVASYRHHVNLRLEMSFTVEGTQCDAFTEDWTQGFLHPPAKGYWVDIYYNQTFLHRTFLVSVDEGRAMLPPPKGLDSNKKMLIVEPLEFRLAEIFDDGGLLDRYFQQSGLKLAD